MGRLWQFAHLVLIVAEPSSTRTRGLKDGLSHGEAVRVRPALRREQALAGELVGCRPVPYIGVAARVAARRWATVRFQAGHIPSWHKSSERYALWPVAAGCHRSLLLLSRLLSPAMRPRLAAFLPLAVVVMRRVPNGYNGLSFPNCYEVRTDDGHLIRAAYV
jgi:hypothetical protein